MRRHYDSEDIRGGREGERKGRARGREMKGREKVHRKYNEEEQR